MSNKKGTVHIFKQGKGGVGKTVTANFFAQYRLSLGKGIELFDIDPVNSSLSEFKSLEIKSLSLLRENEIDQRAFDGLMEALLQTSGDAVVDTGSSIFVPLMAYMIENKAIEQLIRAGKSVVIHMVIAGGQTLDQTLSGFDTLATNFSREAGIVVWLNEYFGPIEIDGLDFEQLAIYQTHKDRLLGLIRIPRKTERTFLEDLRLMLSKKMLFNEAITSNEFFVMSQQRLKIYRDIIFDQLKGLPL